MNVQVGDFHIIRGPPTVLLTQILRNTVFFKSQNPRKAGTLCISQAETKITKLLKAEQISKRTTIFTQNDNFIQPDHFE